MALRIRHLLLFSLLILSACGREITTANGQQVAVTATEFRFTPAEIHAKVGVPLTILFSNEGALTHDWAIIAIPVSAVSLEAAPSQDHDVGNHTENSHTETQPAIHGAAEPNGRTKLTFTPTKGGVYEIVCTVAGHKEAGMHGKLYIES